MEKRGDEDELKKAEELYRSISLHSQTGIAIVQEGKLVFVNPCLLKCFGYTEKELLGKTMLEFIHPDDREEVRRSAILMLKGQSSMPYTYRTMSKGGQIIWVVETVSSITYGGSRAILGNIMDVTERRELEKQLADAREMLIRAEKLSAVGTLAGGISHEILNPLNIISLNLQMLELQDWPPEKTREMLAVCGRQVERIERIARDMNIFARVSRKELSAADINGLIESVLNLIGPKLRLARIAVEKQLQPDLPEMMLDINNIWQVIANMIGNAADAMENKEGKVLRVTTEIRATPEGDVVRMVFADTGTGIDEEKMQKIFDPFFTTKEPGKGTGLGLSITCGIVQEHGGRIWAENNGWGGASFIVERIIRKKSDMAHQPESVVVGYTNERGCWSWQVLRIGLSAAQPEHP
jgi:PAS domain S-box-containing protein